MSSKWPLSTAVYKGKKNFLKAFLAIILKVSAVSSRLKSKKSSGEMRRKAIKAIQSKNFESLDAKNTFSQENLSVHMSMRNAPSSIPKIVAESENDAK